MAIQQIQLSIIHVTNFSKLSEQKNLTQTGGIAVNPERIEKEDLTNLRMEVLIKKSKRNVKGATKVV